MKSLILTLLMLANFGLVHAQTLPGIQDPKKNIRCFGSLLEKGATTHKIELAPRPYTTVGVVELSGEVAGYFFMAVIRSSSAHSAPSVLQDQEASIGLEIQPKTTPGFSAVASGKMEATGFWDGAKVYGRNLSFWYPENQQVSLACSINDALSNP